MNYKYNSKHQDVSNLSPNNLLSRLILILHSYFRPRVSVKLLLIHFHFHCYLVIQYIGYPSMNLLSITNNFKRHIKPMCLIFKLSNFSSPKGDYLQMLYYTLQPCIKNVQCQEC